MKNEFCKVNDPTKYFNEELNKCVNTCGFGEVYDPFTGDCSTLQKIRNKYKKVDAEPAFLQSLTPLLFLLNIVIIAVAVGLDLYKTGAVENKEMYIAYIPVLVLAYYNCAYSSVILSLLLSISIYHTYKKYVASPK
jgi:hypothetical protein